jgi:carboxyl-terminal processing protease
VYRTATWSVAAVLGALLLALVFTLGYVSHSGDGPASTRQEPTEIDGSDVDLSTIRQIINILDENYINRDNLDQQALYEAAIQGMLDSLADTGTFYIDPTSYQLSIGPSGSFEGIGATVQQQGDQIIIVRPFEGSPAEAAGIQPGDAILAVDGESTASWSVDKAVLRIRGPKGSEVTLSIRHLDGATEELTIVRDEIQVESVTTVPPGGVLRDADGNEATDLAYLRIGEFVQHTPQEVAALAAEAESSGKDGLIVDLRANPGGLLQETVDTADLFLDDGIILIEVDRDDNERLYRARPGGAAVTIPVVILMDANSASGSEVFASALRDNDRAILIGETSYGKGTVNVSHQLMNGGALFVTIRRWLTPNGVQIDHVGITPDVEVGPGPFDPQYDPLQDAQIFSAIEQLRNLAASAP